MTAVLRWLGYIQPSHLPFLELLKFVLFANFSIVGMNVSLMWNSVGFYQVIFYAFFHLILGQRREEFLALLLQFYQYNSLDDHVCCNFIRLQS